MTRLASYKFKLLRALLLASVACLACIAQRSMAQETAIPPAVAQSPSTPCTGVPQADLCAAIEAATLADLRWPNFNDYSKEVKDFYLAGGYSLVWSSQNQPTPQALALIAALQNAEKKGLRSEDYDASRWSERLTRLAQSPAAASSGEWAKFDLALTVSAMRYISDLHNGRISPQYFEYGLDVAHKKYKLAEFLRTRVIAAQDVARVLEKVEPSNPFYLRTRTALEQYVALAKAGEGDPLPVPTTDKIKPRDVYPGIPQLAGRLKLLGDLHPDAPVSASNIYDGVLVKAVKHFQQRHGLTPDGIIDHDTFNQLVAPLSRRVEQLQFMLERWRWLPSDLHAPMIVVNIPEFKLHAYRDREIFTMKTVVGKALEHQTPVFADSMRFLIFRPFWNVPDSIVEKELLPAIQKNKAYLDKHQYEVVTPQGEVIPSDKINANVLRQLKAKQLEVRQTPGPGNSLGLIKFVFPNHFDVYLHGTPEKGLFARSRRDFSHGCVRVENPEALAAWLLQGDPDWTQEKIHAAIEGDITIQLNLARPVPVLILYGTASVEENGEVRFFEDIYGHDAQLQSALASGLPYPTQNPVASTNTPNPAANTAVRTNGNPN
ncbi:MAG TPA: L,D-transpeptidase family protein [Candidatus Angelobacter sp.]|nr:L,D-transpeptidase family protein [Candidatus Angelobacter sp.]